MEFKEGEAMAIGQAMYEKIRDEMEEHYWGRMVVIDVKSDYEIGGAGDVKSGDYEIGGAGDDDWTVTTRLRERRPDAYTWGELVGYPAPYSFVGPLKPLPRREKNVG